MNRHTILITLLLSALSLSVLADENIRTPLQIRENIKVVYQVSDDALYEGVNKGLFYARKLMNTYEREGITADKVDLRLVFHGKGIHVLVKQAKRAELDPESSTNPNLEILAELVTRGVHLELCEDTMRQKKVTPEDLLQGVNTVVGAYPRLIDLQLQGYAYIKFE